MRNCVAYGWLIVALLVAAPSAEAMDDIRKVRVQFEPGASSAVVEASITGHQTVDYVLGASAGQLMNVSMATDNGANYFNILPPGEDEGALFVGSTSGNQYEGLLPESGDYAVRVYMMRSAARRDETANYRLEMIVAAGEGMSAAAPEIAPETSPETSPESAPELSAARAGAGEFDATGQIPCAQAAGQPMGQCDFGVAREGDGTATVAVTKPDGSTRLLFFAEGAFGGADISQADGDISASAERESDLNRIKVGDERYEIPDAALFGG